tara:strand:+ start:184 stop:297 length:114 start_codon:yes stop_codon:yes gene_type:complete
LTQEKCKKCGSKFLHLVIQQEYRGKACIDCGYEEAEN